MGRANGRGSLSILNKYKLILQIRCAGNAGSMEIYYASERPGGMGPKSLALVMLAPVTYLGLGTSRGVAEVGREEEVL